MFNPSILSQKCVEDSCKNSCLNICQCGKKLCSDHVSIHSQSCTSDRRLKHIFSTVQDLEIHELQEKIIKRISFFQSLKQHLTQIFSDLLKVQSQAFNEKFREISESISLLKQNLELIMTTKQINIELYQRFFEENSYNIMFNHKNLNTSKVQSIVADIFAENTLALVPKPSEFLRNAENSDSQLEILEKFGFYLTGHTSPIEKLLSFNNLLISSSSISSDDNSQGVIKV